jgi:hypothetical protein
MPFKCVAALVLTLGLAAVAVYSVSQGIIGTLPVLVLGIGLGATYVVRGGSLPAWAYRWVRGRASSLEPDEDPSHLPAKVYLPILLAVIALAALVFWAASR